MSVLFLPSLLSNYLCKNSPLSFQTKLDCVTIGPLFSQGKQKNTLAIYFTWCYAGSQKQPTPMNETSTSDCLTQSSELLKLNIWILYQEKWI